MRPSFDEPNKGILVLSVIAAIAVSVCSSVPAPLPLLDLHPGTYDDSDVRIEYRIGTRVYFLKIINKTEMEVFLHPTRSLSLPPSHRHGV